MWAYRQGNCGQRKVEFMRVLILANYDAGLYKFRRELLEALVKEHDVFSCVPDGGYIERIKELGCQYTPCDFLNRHGKNPLKELQLLRFYQKLLREIKPDVVLTYTIKPNVYGGMACARAGIPYIANVTGLGTAIENPGALQEVVLRLYHAGLKKAEVVFFQNEGNRHFFTKHGIVSGRTELLPGSGVNTDYHAFAPYPEDEEGLVFSTVGRIMRDKGCIELAEAARRVKQKYPEMRFCLIGSFDEKCPARLKEAIASGVLEHIESQQDVRPFYAESHAIIHPSYHEGMSNVLLEAAAAGRPVLASNVPGCRETFDEGVSGIGFEPKNIDDLVRVIKQFIALPYEKKAAMGRAGREKVEREFDRKIVVDAYMKEIHKIEESKHAAL